jgi:hypothetical protein
MRILRGEDVNEHERQAVGLYAILARDACDFIDMVQEAPTEALRVLLEMLATPNPKHDDDTRRLNAFGVAVTERHLARRATEERAS